jgi:hypothetical protein
VWDNFRANLVETMGLRAGGYDLRPGGAIPLGRFACRGDHGNYMINRSVGGAFPSGDLCYSAGSEPSPILTTFLKTSPAITRRL